jgi:hypothetical protein
MDIFKEKLLAYKDAVTAVEGIAPVSVSWAKKHILGFSDEEIKLDLQQQRIEKAAGAELANTATIITHTGIFDNIDKLYGNKPGAPQAAGATPPAEPGVESGGGGDFGAIGDAPEMGGEELGAPTPPGPEVGGEAGVTPESFKKTNHNILLENESLLEMDQFIDLSKAKNYLGEMEQHLNKLLND